MCGWWHNGVKYFSDAFVVVEQIFVNFLWDDGKQLVKICGLGHLKDKIVLTDQEQRFNKN